MILDLAYTNKSFYASNQIRSKPIYSLNLGATSLYTSNFCHQINALTFIKFVIKTVTLIKLTSA